MVDSLDPQRVHLLHLQEQIFILRVQCTHALPELPDGERKMTMFTLGGSANLFPTHSDIPGSRAMTIYVHYAANQAVRASEWPGFFANCIFAFAKRQRNFFRPSLSFKFLSN